MQTDTKIPFTIITGFLGAGKTTLLNHLLVADHGYKLAVIINEFGAVNIDSKLIAENVGEGMVEMTNGCVCCTVNDDLKEGLQRLLQQNSEGKFCFDHIIMETTGMAKVGPIVQTLATRNLKDQLVLGGVVTLVDAYHVSEQFEEFEEVPEQIGMADLIVLNKIDLIDGNDEANLRNRLSSMNKGAQLVCCQNGKIEVATILALRSKRDTGESFVKDGPGNAQHSHGHDHSHTHNHTSSVSSFVIQFAKPLDQGRVQDWFSYIIMRHTEKLLRYKGHLNIKGRTSRRIIQGVQGFLETRDGHDWEENEIPVTELVFIGKNLPEDDFRKGLAECASE